MSETLKSIIDSYRSGLLSTTNIQVFEKKLSDETIKFPSELIADLTFDSSTFKNSDLINMEFINVNFESSCFEKCLVENCIFENTILRAAEFDDCMFKNCRFIDCNLSEVDFTETIFNECTFFMNKMMIVIVMCQISVKQCHALSTIKLNAYLTLYTLRRFLFEIQFPA